MLTDKRVSQLHAQNLAMPNVQNRLPFDREATSNAGDSVPTYPGLMGLDKQSPDRNAMTLIVDIDAEGPTLEGFQALLCMSNQTSGGRKVPVQQFSEKPAAYDRVCIKKMWFGLTIHIITANLGRR